MQFIKRDFFCPVDWSNGAPGRTLRLAWIDIDGETPFYRFIDIFEKFLKGFALGCASRYGWDFRPVSTFFRFMNDNLEFHNSLHDIWVAACHAISFQKLGDSIFFADIPAHKV